MSPTKRRKGAAPTPPPKPVSKAWNWLRGAFLLVGGAIGGGIIGFLTNYWVDYRSDFRSSLDTQLATFKEVSSPVSDSLRDFFLIAQGQRAKTAADVETLRDGLFASVTEAQLLADRIDKAELLHAYQEASISLQKASQAVTGPLDAKQLIQAANDYLLAEQRLQTAAQDSYKSLM